MPLIVVQPANNYVLSRVANSVFCLTCATLCWLQHVQDLRRLVVIATAMTYYYYADSAVSFIIGCARFGNLCCCIIIAVLPYKFVE